MILFVFILSSIPSNMYDFLNATGFILYLKLLFNTPYLWKVFKLFICQICVSSVFICVNFVF